MVEYNLFLTTYSCIFNVDPILFLISYSYLYLEMRNVKTYKYLKQNLNHCRTILLVHRDGKEDVFLRSRGVLPEGNEVDALGAPG